MSIEFQHAKLPNGLTILGEVRPGAHTAAAGFFVKTGSRDETAELMGVSHFLEHMMFKGTARRSAADVNREFDEIGANYNASTSQEVTCYWAHVLPEMLPRAIDLLSDMLRPSLRQEDFDVEKKVILEEIGMYADKPFWTVYEQAMEDYFAADPLAYRILGTPRTIERMTRDQMRGYFEQRYSADNIVVALAGRIDFQRCVEQIGAACGSWRRTGAGRVTRPLGGRPGRRGIVKPDASMHYVLGLMPGPGAQDEARYAAAVLATVLGDSDGSRLYWKLIDPGLAEEADFSLHSFDAVGTYMVYASCDPDHAAAVEQGLNDVLSTAGENLTSDETARAVAKIAMDLTIQNERPAGRMMAVGGQWVYLNRYVPLDEELRRIESVDVGALRELIERYPLAPTTLVRLSPQQT
jgi:predicted Zn-dependent peptidase